MIIMSSNFLFYTQTIQDLENLDLLVVHLAEMNEQHYTPVSPNSHAVFSNGQLPLSSGNLVNLPLLCLATFEK